MKKLMFAVAMAAAMTASADYTITFTDHMIGNGSATALKSGLAYVVYANADQTDALKSAFANNANVNDALQGFSYIELGTITDGKLDNYVSGGTAIVPKQDAQGVNFVIVTEEQIVGKGFSTPGAVNIGKFIGEGKNSTDNSFSGTRDGTYWNASNAIPEPTSALLMLLGMAGLALRRKQA